MTSHTKKYQQGVKARFLGKNPLVISPKENKKTGLKKAKTPTKNWLKVLHGKQLKKTNPPKLPKPVRLMLWPLKNKFVRALFLGAIILFIGGCIYILRDLPSPRKLTSKENYAVSTLIYDRNGTLLYEIFADENRIPIQLKDLPVYVKQATISIEDKNFYHHFGFDVMGIGRAVIKNLQGGRLEGGSTITQQLVKNALLTSERSLKRKAKEALLSVATELIYSKDEILEMYLNYISYGGTAVGIESASQMYFDKSAKDLTLAEASMLAGLPQAPSKYSPFGSNITQAKERQADVLRRMVDDGYITALQAEEAKAEVLHYALTKNDILAPHFVFYIRDLLYEKYGVDTVEKGGLRVTTTLDLTVQQAAQASLSAEINKLERQQVSNGAAMVVKPNTGEILAMVGSRDYFDEEHDGKVNIALSMRQPGSSIKPIMYATAFQQKLLNPGSILLDIPTCFAVPGQKNYCPKNYDGSYKGPVTIRQSIGNSLNIPAVKGLSILGLETFINQARKMGITTWTDPSKYGLSLTLGGGEVKMIDLAQAFSVIADEGVKVPFNPILKVETYTGEKLEENIPDDRKNDLTYLSEFDEQKKGTAERVMDRAPAYLVAHIMQDNNARTAAFGPHSKLIIPNQVVSAKTGTTNNLKDNWTVGFTPELLTIVWVGNNDGKPMNQNLVSGVTGAAPIWNDIMSFLLKNRAPIWQEKPADVASAQVCVNGMPPAKDNDCKPQAQELYWKEGLPSGSTMETKNIWVKAETGLPPVVGEQADNLVLQERTIYADPVTKQYCADCARPIDEQGRTVYEEYVVKEETNNQTTQN